MMRNLHGSILRALNLGFAALCLMGGLSRAEAQTFDPNTIVYIDALWQRAHAADCPSLILKEQKQTMTLAEADLAGYRIGESGQSGREDCCLVGYPRQHPKATIPSDALGVAEVMAGGVLKYHVHGCHRFTPSRKDFRMTLAEVLATPGGYLCEHCEERGPGFAQMSDEEWNKLPSGERWVAPAGWAPSPFSPSDYPAQEAIDQLLAETLHGPIGIQERIFINPVATVDNFMIMRFFFPVHRWLELYQAYRVTGDPAVLEQLRGSARHYNALSQNYLSAAQKKAQDPEGLAYMYTMAASARITLQLARKYPGQVTAAELAEAEDFLMTIRAVLQPTCEGNDNLDSQMGIPQALADDFRTRAFNRALNGIGTIGMTTAALEDLQGLNGTTAYQSTIDRYRKIIQEYIINWKNTGFFETVDGKDYFSYPYSATDKGSMVGDVKLFGADDQGHFSHSMQGAYILFDAVPELGVDDAFMTAIANTIHFNALTETSGSTQTPSQEAIRPYSRQPYGLPSDRFYLLEAFKDGVIDAQCVTLNPINKETTNSAYSHRLATFNAQYLKALRQDRSLIHMAEESVAPPAAPTGLSATGSNGFVTLDWDDNGEGDLSGYRVYRSTTSGSGYTEIAATSAGTSSYVDSNVVNDTLYYYVVTARDHDGKVSSNSPEVVAAPFIPNATPPASPDGLGATVSDRRVSLDWADNSEADLAGYRIYRSTTAGSFGSVFVSLGTVSEWVDTDVINGTTYHYQVKAIDHSGNQSLEGAEISAIPEAYGPTIDFGSGFDGDGGFTVSVANGTEVWSLTADSLQYAFGLPGVDEGHTASLLKSYTVNRAAGASYTFEGVVDLTAGYGDDNNRIGLLLFNRTATQTEDGGGGLYLRLNADDGNNIAINNGINGTTLASSPTGVNPGDLWIGQTLTFTVDLDFVDVGGIDKIDLTLTLTDGSLNTYTATTQVNAADYPGTYFGFASKWRQRGDGGSRDAPAVMDYKRFSVIDHSGPVADTTPPARPIGLVATAGDEFISLDWSNNSESDLDHYAVYRSNTSDSYSLPIAPRVTTSSYLDEDVVNGVTYYYVVTAIDQSGNPSPWSEEDNATPFAPNQAPSFRADVITGGAANEGADYIGSITGEASDPDEDPLTFSKVSGPDWLLVGADGSLSGAPTANDVGPNAFVVRVDALGGSDTATLNIQVDAASTGGTSTVSYDFGSGAASLASAGLSTYVENTGAGEMFVTNNPGDGQVGVALYNETNSGGREAQGFYRSFTGLGPNHSDDFVITATFTTPYRNWNQPVIGIHLFGDTASGAYANTGLYASIDATRNLEIWSQGVENGVVLSAGTISQQVLTASTTTIKIVGNYGNYGSDNLQLVLTVSVDGGITSSIATTVDTTGFTATQTGFGVSANSDDDNRFVVKTFSVTLESAVPNQAPVFSAATLSRPTATEGEGYSESITSEASDPDTDPLIFSKVSGPDWLFVAESGSLSGTPTQSDVGPNEFVVEVSDGKGGIASATLQIAVDPAPDTTAPATPTGLNATEASGQGPWTPSQLTLAGWFDASDAATVTQAGGSVSQWDDKSGNGLHLTQPSVSQQPVSGLTSINGVNAIDFDGSNDTLVTSSNPFGPTIEDAFVIAVHRVDTIGQGTLFSLSGSMSGGSRWQAHAPWSGTVYFDTGGTGGGARVNAPYGVSAGDNVLVGFYGSTTDNVQQVFKNGSLLVGDASGHSVNTVGNLSIGSSAGGQFQNTSIGEVIIINGTVSAEDRQKLEGYLAHKWGLAAELPSAHPYKNATPGGTAAGVDLDWNDNSEVDFASYRVYRRTASGSYGLPLESEQPLTTSAFTDLTAESDTTHFYVVTAVDAAGNESPWSAEVSVTPGNVTPPAAPDGLSATAGIGVVYLDWNDNSEADFESYTVHRSTAQGVLGQVIESDLSNSAYTDSTVTDNVVYYYQIVAKDDAGNLSAPSGAEPAEPGYITDTPIGQTSIHGTVAGSLSALGASDDSYQTLTEVISGSTSVLEHIWNFNVSGAEVVTFYVEAHHTANSEGDDFVFAYSTDGVAYNEMLKVSKTSDDDAAQYFTLPSGLSGTVYIRVTDTDATDGHTQLDSLYIDTLVIDSETSRAAPSAASEPDPANGAVDVATDQVLSWKAGLGAVSHNVYFGTDPSPAFQGNQSGTSFDPGPLAPNTTYYWSVDEVNSSGTTSGAVWSFTTEGAGPKLATVTLAGVGDAWTQVELPQAYVSPVVVASVVLPNGTTAPMVARVRNVGTHGFELRLQNPSGPVAGTYEVHVVVVEAGVYTIAEHGVKLEAFTVVSTGTNAKNAWSNALMEPVTPTNSFTNPVVLGQVMSANDSAWSVFWASDGNQGNPAKGSSLYVGKHVGEDSLKTRADETLGVLILEAGNGTIEGLAYTAGVGTDTVLGVGNGGPFGYNLSGLSSASQAAVSSAGMDGADGGWPVLFGASPLSADTLNLAIDEDQIGDSERAHTSEQVSYLVFE